MNEWEHVVQGWEVLANDLLSDAVKRQILLDVVPPGNRVQLTFAGHQSYDTLRSAIMSYLFPSPVWDATAGRRNPASAPPVPMEVDALTPLRRSKDDRGRQLLGKPVT